MGYKIIRFDDTPNPNAVKCILDRPISDRPRSFFNAEQAAEDVVASSLFGVDGVTNVLMNGDWVTVNKRADAAWKDVKAGVKRALGRAP